jgi:rod shape-determining protein MreB
LHGSGQQTHEKEIGLMFRSWLRRVVGPSYLAVDLGTANTRVYKVGAGIIADQPTVIDAGTDAISLRHGKPAMIGGFVMDVAAAGTRLSPLLRRAHSSRLFEPRVLAGVPTGASRAEGVAVRDALKLAGAVSVAIIEEPLAAAVGADLDIWSPYGRLLIDVGEGITEMAVVSSGSVAASAAIRIGCHEMHDSVRHRIASRYGVAIGTAEARRLTEKSSLLGANRGGASITVSGLDLRRGGICAAEIGPDEFAVAVRPVAERIAQALRSFYKSLPDMLACEAVEDDVCLTGGGALLSGLDTFLSEQTGLGMRIAADPMHDVVRGAGRILESMCDEIAWEKQTGSLPRQSDASR